MNVFKKIAASVLIAGAMLAGSALPSQAATHKSATLSGYFTSVSACHDWVIAKAEMIDKWKGYTVRSATCTKASGRIYKGSVYYLYWA